MTMRGVLVACLLVAILGVGVHSYPARKLDLAEELLNEAETEGDEVEVKSEDIKKDEVAGSGAAARKDTVAVEKKEDPESDESDSPASGDEDTSGDDSTDVAASGNSESSDEDAGSKRKRAAPDEEEDSEDKDEKFVQEEENGSGADDGSTSSSESEDKGQEAEVKKTKVTNVCGSKRCDCEWAKDEKDDKGGEKKKEEEEENAKKRCDCECEEDEPDEEHEHCHHCHGHEQGCHGCHECEHHHCDDHGHHEHDDCCHHHGHHHGFVHEWGEECCGDHDCHDCCGEHEHEHHDEGDHHHEHCCHDNHCCHHKEEEEEEPHCCCHKRSQISVPKSTASVAKRANVPSSPVKKQTVHVGYGYASGDNYRLGYQQGGMGGLASTFTGQIGAEQQGSYDAADHYNKREPTYQPGPVREKRFYGGHAFGNLESGIAHGSATPYGHPVTHPGFTTMGFPGHALASQDVRAMISHPQVKRSIVYEEPRYPYVGYAWSLPYELVQ